MKEFWFIFADEDCDIDSLAAFLEEDGDFEEGKTGNKLARNKDISLSEESSGPSQSQPACAVISEPLQSQSSDDEKCEPSLSQTAFDEMSEQEEEEDDDTYIQGKVKVAHHFVYSTDVSDKVKILMSVDETDWLTSIHTLTLWMLLWFNTGVLLCKTLSWSNF